MCRSAHWKMKDMRHAQQAQDHDAGPHLRDGEGPLELDDREAQPRGRGKHFGDHHQDQPEGQRLADAGHDLRARGRQHQVPDAAPSRRCRRCGLESESTGSTARTPSMVFSSTGQTQPEMITTTFMESVMPMSSISTGTRTGGGMARKNSSVGSSRARSHRTDPIRTPPTTPMTIAASDARPRAGRAGQDVGEEAVPEPDLAEGLDEARRAWGRRS